MINSREIRALVTRPAELAEPLVAMIQSLGAMAWSLPMIQIQPLAESQTLRDRILQLDHYSKVIVISQNAARLGLEHIENYWPQMPLKIHWYAVGPKTRRWLKNNDIEATCPEIRQKPGDSEALLRLESLQQVSGEKILILKGKGGRELLETTLRNRGAQVDCLELYERRKPDYPKDYLNRLIKDHAINVILTSSGEILANTVGYLSPALSQECYLVVPSDRIARMPEAQAFKRVYTARGADNHAMVSVLNLINSEGLT
ncbi:uroporphyrinogen-III synthase [Endozoicomonas sp. 8E]|uniref:uroporphyrinogen-III synthase n=1 Tax=Endozoicomonas sp. 8E TaxID=3035692 RepID=UPI0029392CF4|nr:uroporphyrinogen-III synthase [Endozoicomonas sp. 8E]WOG28434.1 uroporphyrinogen-III synthase [Endozoicomonas sp. 8E]